MMWIIIIIAIAVFGYFAYGMIVNSQKPESRKSDEAGLQSPEDDQDIKETPEEAGIRKRHIAAYEHYGKIIDLIKERKYSQVLKLIEKTLANADFDYENGFYAKDTVRCFVNLVKDMSPQETLGFYDKLKMEGRAVEYAEHHGHLSDFAEIFAKRLSRSLRLKSMKDLKDVLDLITGEHPLAGQAVKIDTGIIANFLDSKCGEIFHNWKPLEDGETLERLIPKIEERLED